MQSTHLSKLIRVLEGFDEPRFRRLKEYIHSPYFHLSVSSIALFDYLALLYPEFPEKKIGADMIARKEKNLPTSIKQSKAGTEVLKAIDEFIALEDWRKDKNNVTKNQLHGYKELRFYEQFNEVYEETLEKLNLCPEQDIDTFHCRHIYTELKFNGVDACLQRNSHNSLEPVIKTLDEYFALKKLRYICEILNRRQVLGITYQEKDIPILLEILAPYTNEKYPYVYLFVNIYRMLEAKTFEESKQPYLLIRQFISQYTGKELLQSIKESICYAINHCLYWQNRGHDEAQEEYLWWVELKMKHGLLLEHNIMMPITFRNVIISVVGKKEPEWLSHFISVYTPYLPQEYRETSIAFAKGILFYVMKKYKEAMRYFMTAQAKEEPIFNCVIRKWEWMCLYESDPSDTDTLHNHLHSFEKYLQRHNNELHHLKPGFDKFIAYAMRLLKTNGNETLKSGINNLQEESYFVGKPWLLKQFTVRKLNTRKQDSNLIPA